MLGVNGLKLQLRAGGKAGSSYICSQYRVFSAENDGLLGLRSASGDQQVRPGLLPRLRWRRGCASRALVLLTQGR